MNKICKMAIKVGLTGGIGSGKTTIAKLFETLDIPVYYADIKAKKLMRSNKSIKFKIKKLLGNDAYYTNGYPNRKYIAQKVFTNKLLLQELNNIIHPAVKNDLDLWFEQNKDQQYVIYESALILDQHNENQFDLIISVISPLELRISRLLKRDHSNRTSIMHRINNQINDQERVEKSDFVIYNDMIKMLIPQVYKIHHKLSRPIK